MADPHLLTRAELFWVVLLAGMMLREFLVARLSDRTSEIFKPTVVIALFLAYYALVGPLLAVANGEWFDRGIDRRSDMVVGWAGAAIFYLSCLVGFYFLPAPPFQRRLLPTHDLERLYRLGTRLCQVGLLLFSSVAGLAVVYLLNPFAARTLLGNRALNVFGGEGFANYFLLSLNFLIPGICLIFASWVQSRRHLLPLLVWFVAASGIFVTLGFRFRLVLLIGPLLIVWYLIRRRRPRLLIVSLVASLLIFSAGYIGLTRSYGSGLDLAGVQGMSNEEIFAEGFGESHVFLTTGAMMVATPEINSYVGIQPILSVLQFPIPRTFFPEKDTFGYLERSIANLFGSPLLGAGSALLCYGEWFLMAGWFSLVLLSLLFGCCLRCLWNWFLYRQHEPFAVTCYALAACFLYVVVSRGYMAQVVATALFTVAPLFWLYYRWAKPVVLRVPSPTPPLSRR
jgi:hypothetical protein